ncbi:MAG: hypothetical protein KF901_11415 [Myxococcales bacterium]|nr:hypothetical protein [Myxococcales bacterium]
MSARDDDLLNALGRHLREEEEAMDPDASDTLGPLRAEEQARLTESILGRLGISDPATHGDELAAGSTSDDAPTRGVAATGSTSDGAPARAVATTGSTSDDAPARGALVAATSSSSDDVPAHGAPVAATGSTRGDARDAELTTGASPGAVVVPLRPEEPDARATRRSDAPTHGASPRPKIIRRWTAVAVTLAAAAAATLWILPRATRTELPTYALVAPTPDATHRDDTVDPPSPGPRAYALGRELEVLLRPATRVEAPVDARAWLVRERALERLDVTPERVDGGALIFRVPTGEPPLSEAGPARLLFVLAPESALPDAPRDLDELPRGVQRIAFDLQLTTSP